MEKNNMGCKTDMTLL